MTNDYPHVMSYWKYSHGLYKVTDEADLMVIGYDNTRPILQQLYIESFEFFTIVEQNNQ